MRVHKISQTLYYLWRDKFLESGKIYGIRRSASLQSKDLKVKQTEVYIDEEKIKQEAQWDGYIGYVTNNSLLIVEQVLGAYKMLYKIEESFRCMKSSFDLRPVYHWTERRIKGHLCFLSFYVLRVIQRKLTEAGLYITAEQAMEELDRVREIKIKIEKTEVYARTAIQTE